MSVVAKVRAFAQRHERHQGAEDAGPPEASKRTADPAKGPEPQV